MGLVQSMVRGRDPSLESLSLKSINCLLIIIVFRSTVPARDFLLLDFINLLKSQLIMSQEESEERE